MAMFGALLFLVSNMMIEKSIYKTGYIIMTFAFVIALCGALLIHLSNRKD